MNNLDYKYIEMYSTMSGTITYTNGVTREKVERKTYPMYL
jgi:hypothetical protein